MTDTVSNAKTMPKVYYGLHFAPGVAEYADQGVEPYRIFIDEKTIKNMDPSFVGRPVYVQHVDGVNLDNLQVEADGYVMESFFNKSDGKHWAKFIVVSDRAHEAISMGWKLSNAYVPKQFKSGGMWHGVEYLKEVTAAEYDHLAIVPNPRYEESVILTPEQFKAYNGEKEIELTKLANSKDKGEQSMPILNLFKRSKVENSADLENTLVLLPKSKVEMTIVQLANEMDDYRLKMALPEQMANGDHGVMVGESRMSVNDLVKKHMEMCNEMDDMKKKNSEADMDADMDKVEDSKKNDESEDEMKKKALDEAKMKESDEVKKNEADKAKILADKKALEQANFDVLKNAPMSVIKDVPTKVDLSMDKTARGIKRYGSQK